MRFRDLNLILLALSIALPATAQEVVYVIRHAEQMLDIEDPPLTEEGQVRAKHWATVFRDAGLDVIITTKKVRTQQTGAAIAEALNVPVEEISRRDVTGLVSRVRLHHSKNAVLVISHTKSIPKLVEAFGHSTNGRIEREDYDNLFVIVPRAENDATVLRLRY